MSATNFKTVNQTYRQLIGNGLTYCIPRFQRDYSWTDEEWDDLWQDLLSVFDPSNNDDAHYMGYLVLQSNDDKVFYVIDGQQRLTTLSIIVLAGLKNLKKLISDKVEAERSKQRLDQLMGTYIGYLDPVTLQSKPKLTLNRNNDHFYKTYLVALAEKMPQRNLKSSEHSLRKAFDWFDRKIAEYMKGDLDKGVVIAQLIEEMSSKLFFTVITVNDELNAYKVFETLNARGVRLSATDLLKNYLFSVIHRDSVSINNESEMADLEQHWEKLVDRLGAESFPDFLRVFWNSRYAFVRQSELFKRVREQISDRAGVFRLIREMDTDIDIYLTLANPSTASTFSINIRKYAEYLKMFSVKQPYSLLMAVYRHLDLSEFEKILKACVNISLRYNVISGLHTGDQERAYHKAALFVNQFREKDALRATDILQQLQSIYVSDEIFKVNFIDKTIKTTSSRNKKVVRYILGEIEFKETHTRPDLNDDSYNIEHIFPQNAEIGWSEFNDKDGMEMVYRLGNMTLCETSLNRDMDNLAFEDKKDFLVKSQFMITQKIADSLEWTPVQITQRQQQMAKLATSIWRIDQLS